MEQVGVAVTHLDLYAGGGGVTGSNVDQDTGYPSCVSRFSSVPQDLPG
jgi:hypothetical protein